jgi:hypothetical protein
MALLFLTAGLGCTCMPTGGAEGGWVSLFDGKKLGDWRPAAYGTQGNVEVEEGMIYIEYGQPLSGIQWAGKEMPKINYEIELEAQRLNGNDFFCTLSFPIGEKKCSFVVGGWGGSVVGLSNIDNEPAIDNPTRHIMPFENGRWYRVRLRVAQTTVQAWIDGKVVLNMPTKGRKITIHPAIEDSLPLGISTFGSSAFIRKIRFRKVTGAAGV